MNLNEYQEMAMKTAVYPLDTEIVYPALGLCGEAGEVAEKIKKVLRDKDGKFNNDDRMQIALELGDVLWYLSAVSKDLGLSLNAIAEMNIHKLQNRKERNKLHGNGDNR